MDQLIKELADRKDASSRWTLLRAFVAEIRRDTAPLQTASPAQARELFLSMASVVAQNPLTVRQVAEALRVIISGGGQVWSESFAALSPEKLALFRLDRVRHRAASQPESPEVHSVTAPETPLGGGQQEALPEEDAREEMTSELARLLRRCEQFMEWKDEELAEFTFPDTQSMTKTFALEFNRLSHLLSSGHFKVGILGERRVGKSCLAAALVGFPYIPVASKFTINFHNTETDNEVVARVPLDLVHFLTQRNPDELASENWAVDICGSDEITRVLRKISRLLTINDEDFEIKIYLKFPVAGLSPGVTLIDFPSHHTGRISELHKAVVVVDASYGDVPEKLVELVQAEVSCQRVSAENFVAVLNKIDSCLEDPAELRELLSGIAGSVLDTRAKSALLECFSGGASSDSLTSLREAIFGSLRDQGRIELMTQIVRRSQQILAEFLEKLAVINSHNSPLDVDAITELAEKLSCVVLQIENECSSQVAELLWDYEPTVDDAFLNKLLQTEGYSERVLIEAVHSVASDVFAGWDCLSAELTAAEDERKTELLHRWTLVISEFCESLQLDGSLRANVVAALQNLRSSGLCPVVREPRSVSHKAVREILELAKIHETSSLFSSSGSLKRWDFHHDAPTQVTAILWTDFVLQVESETTSEYASYADEAQKALIKAFRTSAKMRVSLSAHEREFVEAVAGLDPERLTLDALGSCCERI